jgi:endonuclease/exonuclease/phosphatase family metal-dependent hydrolase
MATVEFDELEWTVLTWNIQGARRPDLTRIASVISTEGADVVALQEVRRPQAEHLADALAMTHVWHRKHHALAPLFPGRAEGAALLSPHPMSEIDHARVSDATSTRSYRHRIVQWAVIERSARSAYRIFNVHLSPHDMHEQRTAEAARVAAIATSLGDHPPTVVAGDLNDAGSPEIVGALPGDEVLEPPPTNPSDRPTQCIDHVLLPAGATGVSVSAPAGGSEWAELSDHLPLTVRFSH